MMDYDYAETQNIPDIEKEKSFENGKKEGIKEELKRCLKELERLRYFDKNWNQYFYDEAQIEAPRIIDDLEKRLKELESK